MQLAKVRTADGAVRAAVIEPGRARLLRADRLSDVLHAVDPAAEARARAAETAVPLEALALLAPLDRQEVWAAGVTYKRSQQARQREAADGGSCYDKVYHAERPELFLKATPHRIAGPGQAVRIRRDARWNVPEPELTLVLSPELRLVGYTVGNDMSSRDIEGENPLYLPQAKVYDQSCALGPVVTLAAAMPPLEQVTIGLRIERGGRVAFEGATSAGEMKRQPADLVGWLGRDNSFPEGAFLLTGTGIVPPDDFTLAGGDLVSITIAGIGTLVNPVVQG
jgi:2-dehydro-3-deoxy-D-arabinonate dehydratase